MVSEEKKKKVLFFWEEDKGKLLNFCMFLKGIGKTSDVCEREKSICTKPELSFWNMYKLGDLAFDQIDVYSSVNMGELRFRWIRDVLLVFERHPAADSSSAAGGENKIFL